MKKLKTLFYIDYTDAGIATATDTVREESAWVLRGEGVATIKIDGTSCLYRDGKLWKRFDRKIAKKFYKLKGKVEITLDMLKAAPEGWEACEDKPDPVTGHFPGWVPVSEEKSEDRWHIEALKNATELKENKTYELIGPKIQANLYDVDRHLLIEHGSEVVEIDDLSFYGLKTWLESNFVEGIVWHHADGSMVKLRRKDFGIPWGHGTR